MKKLLIPFIMSCMFLTNCAFVKITSSAPRLYTEDQSFKVLADLHTRNQRTTEAVRAGEVQEIVAIREAVSRSLDTAASTVGTEAPTVNNTPLTLPSADFQSATLGLSFPQSVRQNNVNNQFVETSRLQYLGDSNIHGVNKKVFLIRFDMAIHNFVYLGNNKDIFAVSRFDVSTEDEEKDVEIHTLMPEFASVISQENYISDVLDDYMARIAATMEQLQLSAAGSLRKRLEERVSTLVENPVQFAIHNKNSKKRGQDSFAFAFGPTRRIVKRSLLNPRRWFETTYTINYEISPGIKSCFAFIVVDKDVDKIKVSVKNSEWLLAFNDHNAFASLPSFIFNNAYSLFVDAFNEEDIFSHDSIFLSEKGNEYEINLSNEALEKTQNKECVSPNYVFVDLNNSLYIQTKNSISPDVQAWIGNLAVTDITILGKNKLRITIPRSDNLRGMYNNANIKDCADCDSKNIVLANCDSQSNNDTKKAKLRLVDPAHGGTIFVADINLHLYRPTSPQPTLTVTPNVGRDGTIVTLQLNNAPTIDLVNSVIAFPGRDPIRVQPSSDAQARQQQRTRIRFAVPDSIGSGQYQFAVTTIDNNGTPRTWPLTFYYLNEQGN